MPIIFAFCKSILIVTLIIYFYLADLCPYFFFAFFLSKKGYSYNCIVLSCVRILRMLFRMHNLCQQHHLFALVYPIERVCIVFLFFRFFFIFKLFDDALLLDTNEDRKTFSFKFTSSYFL